MRFPHDHGPHTRTKIEWWYVWGKLGSSIFFHWALFRKKNKFVLHYSLCSDGEIEYHEKRIDPENIITIDNEWIEIKSPDFRLKCLMECDPHEHKRRYYSVPHLSIHGTLKTGNKWLPIHGNGWFDHAWNEPLDKDWEWFSFKMNNGEIGMVYTRGDEQYCMIGNEKEILKEYSFIPLVNEKIFTPKHGFSYSEQPLTLYKKGTKLFVSGYGVKEKTYRYREQ